MKADGWGCGSQSLPGGKLVLCPVCYTALGGFLGLVVMLLANTIYTDLLYLPYSIRLYGHAHANVMYLEKCQSGCSTVKCCIVLCSTVQDNCILGYNAVQYC